MVLYNFFFNAIAKFETTVLTATARNTLCGLERAVLLVFYRVWFWSF